MNYWDQFYVPNSPLVGTPQQQQEPSQEQPPLSEEDYAKLAELGMFDERADALKRKMSRAEALRKGGGYQGGTYGRWGAPMPYNPIGDIAREAVANFQTNRAENQAAEERKQAQEAMKMYTQRLNGAGGPSSPQQPPLPPELAGIQAPAAMSQTLEARPLTTWEKLKQYGASMAPRRA